MLTYIHTLTHTGWVYAGVANSSSKGTCVMGKERERDTIASNRKPKA